MKKILLLITSIMSLSGFLQAQTSGGPDNYGYIWRDNNDSLGPIYNWIDVSQLPGTVEVTGLTDDNFVGPFQLPASFQYYWYGVTNFWIGSNGYISFNPGLIADPFASIPDTLGTNNFIAAFTGDLNFTGAGNPAKCYYWKSPTQDTAIITWEDLGFFTSVAPGYDGNNDFQIILSLLDSTITFQYKEQVGFSTQPQQLNFLSIGIENNSGNIGLEYAHDSYPVPQTAIRFYPPANSTLLINDASTSYNNNVKNAALFLSKGGASFPLTTVVKNTGNTTLGLFNVNSKVMATNGSTPVTNTVSTSAPLAPGDIEAITQINPFIPVTAGIFRFITTTQLVGDNTPSNDARTMELGVVDTTTLLTELSYENGVSSTTTGISWNGGDGGCANLFIPPYYPCYIVNVKQFIVADPNGVGYSMKVWDNSGPNGTKGNLLDSVFVATSTIGSYSTTPLTAPIRIDSAGFYVEWYMGGEGVALGQNQVAPFSLRSYETLGGSLSEYRARDIEDLMIRAVISTVNVGVNENESLKGIGEIYPNPATDFATIPFDAALFKGKTIASEVYDISGKLVYTSNTNGNDAKIIIPVKDLTNGIYTVRLISEKLVTTKKLNIVK